MIDSLVFIANELFDDLEVDISPYQDSNTIQSLIISNNRDKHGIPIFLKFLPLDSMYYIYCEARLPKLCFESITVDAVTGRCFIDFANPKSINECKKLIGNWYSTLYNLR